MKLIIDIPVEVYEHIKNGELIPVNWDEHIYKTIADGIVFLNADDFVEKAKYETTSNGDIKCIDCLHLYEEVTEGENILKRMRGGYVTYKIEYLMKNLAREIYLLESYMRWKRENEVNDKEEFTKEFINKVFGSIRDKEGNK